MKIFVLVSLFAAPTLAAETAARVDRAIDGRLVSANLTASPLADDAEFLRRVTLDITGRIPTCEDTVGFLEDTASDKRAALIDRLLEKPAYGLHFAVIWQELIKPRDLGSAKSGPDPFLPWLAEQFNRDRGWNQIVSDLLTAEGNLRQNPQTGFITANCENFDPQPNLLADSTSRLFWGVQLRCAECHDHPFAQWKQADFWGTAAFFSRLRRGYTQGKNPLGWTFTEAAPDEEVSQRFGVAVAPPGVPGAAILVPAEGGKLAKQVVNARFLGGEPAGWKDDGPFRSRFADWATSAENPFFARNAANRLWAHFFGRGLVHPLDEFQENNPPTHPEVLDLLTQDLIAADFDLKHLIRVVCSTRAYQRTSRPTEDNANDVTLCSHMAVKLLRPEMLHDALSMVLVPPVRKPGAKQQSETIQPLPGVTRDEFVRFFGVRPGEGTLSIVNQGILQVLRLMNGPPLNRDFPGLTRFGGGKAAPEDVIQSMFLAAYSRHPSATELQSMLGHVAEYSDPKDAYPGMLWALLNSSEFALNH